MFNFPVFLGNDVLINDAYLLLPYFINLFCNIRSGCYKSQRRQAWSNILDVSRTLQGGFLTKACGP